MRTCARAQATSRHTYVGSEAPPLTACTLHCCKGENGGSQDVQNQACAGEEAATEPIHPAVDAYENGQHHQIQLEAENVAQDKVRPLSAVKTFCLPTRSYIQPSQLYILQDTERTYLNYT